MVNLVALDSQAHRKLRVSSRPTGEYAEINVVSVIPRELPRLVAHYPIFFSKSAATGQFEPAALLGFERRENLYLVNDRWDVDYVPLQIQRQPFALLPRPGDGSPGSQPALDVAIDLSSSRIQTQEGEPLFGDDGRASKYLEGITSILKALVSGSTEAFAFTGRLAELGLLESVRIDVEFVNGSQTKLEGVYWIAAAALKALTPPQLAELRDRGFLEWMYFQMASVAHMSGLVARKNRMLSGVTAERAPAGSNGDRA